MIGLSLSGFVIIVGIFFGMVAAILGLVLTLILGARKGLYAGIAVIVMAIVAVGALGFIDPTIRDVPDELRKWWVLLLDTTPFALVGLGLGTLVAIAVRLIVGVARRSGPNVLAGTGRAALVYLVTLVGTALAAAVLSSVTL